MECLTAAGTVVATFTEPPPFAPTDLSSAVCRRPVINPGNNVDKIMEYLANHHPEVAKVVKEAIKRHGKQLPFTFPTGQTKSRAGCWQC